jgi:hypothetical protein
MVTYITLIPKTFEGNLCILRPRTKYLFDHHLYDSDMQKVSLADICEFHFPHCWKVLNSEKIYKIHSRTYFSMNCIIYIVMDISRRKLSSPLRSICQISLNFLCFLPIFLQNIGILLKSFCQ